MAYDLEIELPFEGSISLNKLYSGMHWTKRKKLADSWHHKFKEGLKHYDIVQYSKLDLVLKVNNKLDLDNCSVIVKLCVDTVKQLGFIKDDTPKYFKKMTIVSDKEELKYNTGVFYLRFLL